MINVTFAGADVIAIGAIFAVSTCGGPIIPFSGGRIGQGFNQTEMIKLVACGHTMGGVRSSDFPQLVPPNGNSSVPVIDDFDTAMAFDNAV